MGKKSGRDWFNFAKTKQGGPSNETVSPLTATMKNLIIFVDERPPSPKHRFDEEKEG